MKRITEDGPQVLPMICTGESVAKMIALLKTETRRVVIPQPPTPEAVFAECGEGYDWVKVDGPAWQPHTWEVDGPMETVKRLMNAPPYLRCRHGQPGDCVYIKEQHWLPPDSMKEALIHYDGDLTMAQRIDLTQRKWKRRNSLYMKRDHSRLTLEIGYVHLERLHQITEAGALHEGITKPIPDNGLYWCGHGTTMTDERNPAFRIQNAVMGYRGGFGLTWNTINGKKWPWDCNPWVWVIGFKVLEHRMQVPVRAA